jgi:flagellin-like protein
MMKGVSPVVSFVLVVAIIVTLSMSAYWWASGAAGSMAEPGKIANLESQMVALDHAVRSAAHGDVNFSVAIDIYHPTIGYQNSVLLLWEDTDVISLSFWQNAAVIGATNVTTTNTTCAFNETYFLDNQTNVVMWKESGLNRVFRGAAGEGPGFAEIALCYYDIDLRFAGGCISGTSAATTTVLIKKVGVSAGKPVVEIDFC